MSGQKQNFLIYYNKYKDKIYTFFLYRLNFNKPQADDMVSEVFIKALKSWQTFDADQSFQAWIYKISRNHLINYYKISGREVSLEAVKNKPSDMLGRIDRKHELEKIFNVIKKMDDYYRDVLLLRFVDGLDNSEIALVLEKDEGTIRTQISRALKVLREQLKKKNYG